MNFTDPSAFEQFLAPVGGEVRIRPMIGSHFRADIDIRPLPRVGLFKVEADSFAAEKAPRGEFYSLNIPLNVPFTVSDIGNEQTFGGSSAYMLSPNRPMNFQCKRKCHALACNFYVSTVKAYRERMQQEATTGQMLLEPRISLMTATGSRLFRAVTRAWTALGMDDSIISEIARREMEDDLLASFMSLAQDSWGDRSEALSSADYALKRVEDYISANLDNAITRDDLADTSGVPIRSLSRAFDKRYGVGPMAFVRQRRLDACYTKLAGSDPEETTVSDVAMSYGFYHFGKFSTAYKKAFGESPSTSLKK